MADGRDLEFLVRPGRLSGIALEIAETLDKAILSEMPLQIIREGVVVGLLLGRIIAGRERISSTSSSGSSQSTLRNQQPQP